MANRLTVVLFQASTRDSRVVALEEELLTQVMFEPNMDAVLVGSLQSIQPESTDFLCLSQIGPGSCIVSWHAETELQSLTERLGLNWRIGNVNTKGTLVFHRRLRLEQEAAEVLQELRKLLAAASVKTVQIALPGTVSTTKNVQPQPLVSDVSSTPGRNPVAASAPEKILHVPSSTAEENEHDWSELDQLVDDLDAFDL